MPSQPARAKVKFSRSVSQDPNRNNNSGPNPGQIGRLAKLTQTIRRQRKRFSTRRESQRVARFPKSPVDVHVKLEDLPERAENLENYFHRIFNSSQKKAYRNLTDFKTLFGLSKFTYIKEFGRIGMFGNFKLFYIISVPF